jgi:sodium/bile acid cotransporter 7
MKKWDMIKQYLPDWFISALVGIIVLAYLIPGIGAEGSYVELSNIIHYAIMALFFFYGLRLKPEELVSGLKNWKLHITIQTLTFIVFPLIVLIFFPLFQNSEFYSLWLAVFFLAALPSTVSSSVVMVSIARGNITGAIFNASISGIIGIIITPLWMSVFLSSANSDFNFAQTFTDLLFQIFIPVTAGLLLHRFWGSWAIRNKRYLSIFDKTVILSIVYNSFSSSFLNGIFNSIPKWTLLLLAIVVISLFFTVFNIAKWVSKRLNFSREEQITVLFSGSKKSLIHGSVMAAVLVGSSPLGSLFLVPIMIYHAFQLFYVSIIARKMSMEDR